MSEKNNTAVCFLLEMDVSSETEQKREHRPNVFNFTTVIGSLILEFLPVKEVCHLARISIEFERYCLQSLRQHRVVECRQLAAENDPQTYIQFFNVCSNIKRIISTSGNRVAAEIRSAEVLFNCCCVFLPVE